MTDLERRYLRLLSAYPADYRRARGAEIVGTYLDLAAPDRRWPSPADAMDLLRGGLRQRVRAAGAADLVPGVRLAAVLALLTAAPLAGLWTVLELRPAQPDFGLPAAGPFVSLGIVAWIAWLLAALVQAVTPGRWTRYAVALAVLVTVALVPAAALTGLPRPPLFVLLPQIGLGLVALGAPDTVPAPLRAAPLVAVGVVGLAGPILLPRELFAVSYYTTWTLTPVLPAAAVVVLAVAVLLAAGLALRADHRGGWAALILLTPVGLLALYPLAGATDGQPSAFSPSWASLAATAALVTLVGPALLPLTLALRTRRTRLA
ncbi:hypothetical protein M8C17_18380 [Micromonospora sp. RHAY321]|uniref:hypothetical protein n=1 Tax=Micromonospora sp. RHAY321 TaxID=2944807 RepID=UPI00207C5198|nr:hypothetical protein [Micromonospora sp. RHAY321]MCO1597125.1 hypothetical protein [Micromonospora sp. RHAY321]